ncbi:MAG: hypothetical protein WC645_08185, partial [Candidatus Margulisiibacteriota bacterium]
TAYNWGNHLGLYDVLGQATSTLAYHTGMYDHAAFLTSFTETDPLWSAASTSFFALSDWRATTTDALTEGTVNKYSQWLENGSDIYYTGGNVGVGTGTPVNQLDVYGNLGVLNRGELRMYEQASDGVNYIALKASTTLASSLTWTLPSANGIAGNALSWGANGELIWSTPSGTGGTVGAATLAGQMPYYASASDGLTATSSIFLSANGYFGIGSTTPDQKLSVGGYINSTGLCINGNCKTDWATAGAFDGGGAINTIAYWTDADSLNSTSTLAINMGGTGATSLNNLISLTTHTTGNYVASTTGSDTITISGTLGEGWTPIFSVTDDSITAGKLAIGSNGDAGYVLVSDGDGTFSWSPAGATSGTVKEGLAGQLAFYATNGIVATGTTNLFWDNNNFRLGIGTTTPEETLSVGTTINNQFLVSASGVITDGEWNGDQIDDDYVASSTYWNAAYQNRVISATAPITWSGNTIGLNGSYNIPLIASTTQWNTTYNTVSAGSANWNSAYSWTNAGRASWDAVAASSTFYNTNSNIVNSNYSNWNTAYNWGNHLGLYDVLGQATSTLAYHTGMYDHATFLTSFTETDPLWSAASTSFFALSDWRATTTDALTEGTLNKYSQWLENGSDIYYSGGNVGIGTVNPLEKLSIYGDNAGLVYAKRTGAFDLVTYNIVATGWTDITTEAAKSKGTVSGDILNLVGDYLYIGKSDQFSSIYIDINTARSATANSLIEYSTGEGTWATLTATDGTTNLTVDGTITFTAPGDWAQTTINGAGPYYGVRIGTESGTFTNEPTVYLVVPGTGVDSVQIYANQGDTQPSFRINAQGDIRLGEIGTTITTGGALTIAGALSGVSTAALSGSLTHTLSTTGYLFSGGPILSGPAATAAIPYQQSPIIRFSGQAWNGAATKINAMDIGVNPIIDSGTLGRMIFKNTTIDSIADNSELANITSEGDLNVLGRAQSSDEMFDYVQSYVASVYTNQTLAVSTFGDAATGDVLDTTSDYLYVGKKNRFSEIYFDFGTIMSAGTSRTWEYWNGSSWAALTIASDGTANWSTDGLAEFTAPSDWAATAVNSVPGLYWVRIGTVSGTFATEPTFRLCLPNDNAITNEVLSNGEFDTSTGWSTTGDWAYSTSDYTFTYSSGVGTLTQPASSFNKPLKPNAWYRFRYQVGVAGPATTLSWIGTEVAETKTYFSESTTEVDAYFKTNSAPGDFVIYTTASALSGFRLDAISLLELSGGDINASGVLALSGTNSSSIMGSLAIGTTTASAKLTVGATTSSQLLVNDNGQVTDGQWQGDIIDIVFGGTGTNTLNNLITLGDHTTGNYVASTTGSNTITITGTLGEGWTPVFSVTDDSITASKLAMSGSGNGNINQVLISDGNGTFSWSDIGTTNGTVREGFSGQLAFYQNDGMTATGTTNFHWDNNNFRLGIGTTTPEETLSVGTTINNQFLVSASGIITDGEWNGDQIDDDYVASSTWWNAAYQNRVISATAPITWSGNTIGLHGDYNIPLTASTTQWNTTYNTVSAGSANWNTAYNWGNHAGLYDMFGQATSTLAYHTGMYDHADYDAIVASSTFYNTNSNIVNSNYLNWNAAYASSSFWDLAYAERGSQIAGTNLTWSGGQLNVNDAWYDSLSDITLATGNIFIGDVGSHPVATSALFIASSGNLGIGTTSPLAKLDVFGNFMLSGDNRYINFATSSGIDGYGMRDNGGTLQVKNKNGVWTAIGAGATSFGTLNDVDVTGAGFGSLVYYNMTTGKWEDIATSSLAIDLANTAGTLSVSRGGTGITNTPTLGQILVGNGTNYTLTATSALGLLAPADINSYAELNALVNDVTLTHNGLINTIAKLNTILGGETLASTTSAMTGTFDGIDFTNGTLGAGSLWYGGAGSAPSELAIGTGGFVLMSDGANPSWVSTSTLLWDNDFTENGLMLRTAAGTYSSTSTLAINMGGTGAITISGALANLGLTNIASYGITTVGNSGEIWMSDGNGAGIWTSTSSMIMSSEIDTFAELDAIVSDAALTHNGMIDTIAELNAILGGEDIASTTTFTAGDGLTLTATDFDLDAGLTTVTSIYNTALKVGRDTTDLIDFDTDNQLTFRVNNSDQMLLNSTGNLGVGTTSPLARLDVFGNFMLSGTDRYINFATSSGTDGYGFRDNGGILQMKNRNGAWSNIGAVSLAFDDLTDVDLTGVSFGNLVYYNGSQWVDVSTSSLAINLTDTTGTLSVSRGGTGITNTPALGQILVGNGTNYTLTATSALGLLSPFDIGSTIQGYDAQLQNIANITPAAFGEMIYWNGSNYIGIATGSLGLLSPSNIGSTVQGYDSTLNALSTFNSNGLMIQTAADTFEATTTLAINYGGTGATNPTTARANLGLAIGTDVQAYDAG